MSDRAFHIARFALAAFLFSLAAAVSIAGSAGWGWFVVAGFASIISLNISFRRSD